MDFRKVGFIGLGNMGKPMALNLVKGGIDLIVYDKVSERMGALAEAGAHKSTSPRDLSSQCEIVILMLPGPDEVEEVCLGSNGIIDGAKKETIVIDMSSSHPPLTRRIHDSLIRKEIRMIDAPVTGMVRGAVEGTLNLLVGGDAKVLEIARPVLGLMGKTIYHMGEIGSGHLMKTINNFLYACSMTGTAEAMALAIKSGLDPKKVINVLQAGSGNNWVVSKIFPDVILPGKPGNYANSILVKDLGIFMKVCQELEVPTFMVNLVYGLCSIPDGKEDGSEFFKIYEDWFKIKMKGIIGSPEG